MALNLDKQFKARPLAVISELAVIMDVLSVASDEDVSDGVTESWAKECVEAVGCPSATTPLSVQPL